MGGDGYPTPEATTLGGCGIRTEPDAPFSGALSWSSNGVMGLFAVAGAAGLRRQGIIKMLELMHPMYQRTASYGHFGRTPELVKLADGSSFTTFSWEKTDHAEARRLDAKRK